MTVWACLYIAAGALIAFINFLVILVMLKKRKIRETPSNLFLLIVFAVHMIAGIYFSTIGFTYVFHGPLKEEYTVMKSLGRTAYLIAQIVASSSYWSISGLCADRFIAIKYPFIYETLNYKYFLLYGGIWALTAGALITGSLMRKYTFTKILVNTLCICTAIFVCYTNFTIRQIIKEKFRNITLRRLESIVEEQNKMELKKTRICIVLALSFLCWWFPVTVFGNLLKYSFLPKDRGVIVISAIFGALLNSAFDPIFYMVRSEQFHQEIKDLFRKP